MSLKFYAGAAGSGKTRLLLEETIRRSMEEPDRNFFIIVPEQFTNDTQRTCLSLHPRKGLINIDVLSFARLAHRVFDEVGRGKEEMLEEIGKSFVLEKIALDLAKKLPFFGADLAKPGNIAEMKSLISEMLLYDVHSDDLAREEGMSPLSMKLKDIGTVYRAFEDYLGAHRLMTAEELPDRLARVLSSSRLLADSTVILDGFTGFTPVQLRLVGEILARAREVFVTVTVDPGRDLLGPCRKTDLFGMSFEMARSLAESARQRRVKLLPTVWVTNGPGRYGGAPAISHLESNLFRRRRAIYQEECREIRIFAAKNPYAEVEEAARRIRRLVREEHFRYRDFAIITGDLPAYGNYIRQIFPGLGIPYFIDAKRELVRNAFVEYIRAAAEVCALDYSAAAVFRMLRTGFSDLSSEEIDQLENHVIALGIRGKKKWREKWIYCGRNEDPGELPALNALREKVLARLDPLADEFAVRGSTVRDKTEALYRFLTAGEAEEKLLQKAERFGEAGRQDLYREYKGIYAVVIAFLDKLVLVLGEEKISMRDYRALLEAGFMEQRMGIIPPSADEVMAGDMERSRPANVRVLFFLGVNEGLVPKASDGGGILTEADREKLRKKDIRLKPTPRENVAISRFYMYLALTKPRNYLFLSYSEASEEGQVQRPSYLIGTVRELFPGLVIESEADPSTAEGLLKLTESPEGGLSLLSAGLGEIGENPPAPAFFELFSWYRRNPEYFTKTEAMLDAASLHKPKDRIGQAAARALYGQYLVNSASRLERFSECAFAHFVQYGLRLKEREEFAFSGMDMGNVVHGALEDFAEKLKADGLSWAGLGDEERDRRAAGAVRTAAAGYGSGIFAASSRNEYQIRRMERIVKTTVWALQEQLKRGDFVPAAFEMSFSGNEDLNALSFDLADGAAMTLVGRIDRLDAFEENGKAYIKILDYKTGAKKFDMTAVYYGLQLQLAIYMDAAIETFRKSGREAEPAGIFYYEVRDPIEKADEGISREELAGKILSDMKASGYVSSEPEVLAHLDAALKPGEKSDVYPIELKKDGSLGARSRAISREGFFALLTFASKRAREIAEAIMAGEAEVNPCVYQGRSACDFCPYVGICGFDRKLPGTKVRRLLPMKDEEALALMEKGDRDGSMDE
ncbi:MAG: PD-(D/E)XK nuclease family protein [Lachnospiraceae bacterium]|nr:PD-(D/E)XK nuclease family protein [Lachnospiraceae bacterium]